MKYKRVVDLPEYTVDVHEISKEHYNVVLMYRAIRSGFGNVLTNFGTEQGAIQGAEKFPRMYEIAKQEGFHLVSDEFVHKDGRRVDVSLALDSDRSEFEFRRLLRS